MKHSLDKIKKSAFDNLLNKKYVGSLFDSLDLALFSGGLWRFSLTDNEYIELLSAVNLILDDPRVLVLPTENKNVSISGFVSIYDKLDEKFSTAINNGLRGVKILISPLNVKNIHYKSVVEQVVINTVSSYNDIIKSLKLVGYEKVDYVESTREFCVKGGVIDVYSPNYNNPVRICMYDSDATLNFYSLSTGLSMDAGVDELILTKREEVESLLDVSYLIKKTNIKNKIQTFRAFSTKNKEFICLDYKGFVKNNSETVYTPDLSFFSFKHKNILLAPNSYKKPSLPTPQQEDVALEKGDCVCHEDFGVGLLLGLVGGDQDDEHEFLKIKYEDAVVQLSIKSLHKLSFVSRETNEDVKLNSLSKKGVWSKQKNRVSAFVENKTKDLLSFYANKKNNHRPAFPFGGDLEKEFIESFAYKDTVDQDNAWKEISADLEKDTAMYRLLCGDVGFGKTEISLRAAFRVVVNGGKVLVLSPTSVLARQHYSVFKERLNSFGVIVRLYVGSSSLSNKNDIKNMWIEGGVDIIIGTSAVLYDDVFIKYTSLFIVDEEHKFGVKDKEGVLEGFINKDVLLMSATPIPRSLNLSMSGLNDISTLGTPPIMRKPIQTFVNYFDDNLIKRSIEYEINRGGQVFFVHNNIASLVSIKNFIKRICPMVNIVIAHSKLNKKELESNIETFVKGGAELLLCTSIIGSGVDIPNANTIIINSAHRFGLGQLHQIRGRVGRSDKQGFAYMLIPESSSLGVKSKKRLITIEKNVSLGSGYHIAKSDLQIRGGGMMFGYDQSGKSFDFGFEFYSKLMSKYISKEHNSSVSFIVDNFVYKVDFLCVFNGNYIKNSFDRLRNYRLLNSVYTKSKLSLFRSGLVDRYGPLTSSSENLINMRLFSLYAVDFCLSRVVVRGLVVVFSFNNSFKRGLELFKFLSAKGDTFGIDNYKFKDLEHATELSLQLNKGNEVCSKFLLSFMDSFKEYYEKV